MPGDTRTRAQRNRQVRRDALREELKSREYLRQVHKILDELGEKGLPVNEVQRMKTRMQGYFNLLSKTLPDVKAVELNAIFEAPNASREDMERALQQLGVDPKLIASTTQTKAH
jgi:hypothetical protein